MSSSDEELLPYNPEAVGNEGPFAYLDPLLVNSLTAAIRAVDLEKVKEYLRKGSNPNYPDNNGNTALHWAVLSNDHLIVKHILKCPEVNLDAQNHHGQTALFLGLVNRASDDIIMELLDAGCDIFLANTENVTPLHLAAKYKNPAIAHRLIKMGADVDAADFDSCTPLIEAVCAENFEVIYMLIYYGADVNYHSPENNYSALTHAILQNIDRDVINQLILHTVDLNNICNEEDKTVLWLAVFMDVKDVVRMLIQAGADVNYSYWYNKNYFLSDGYGFHDRHRIEKSIIETSLEAESADVFNFLWTEVNKKYFAEHRCCFLSKLVRYCNFNNKEWLDTFYKVLSSKIGDKLVSNSCPFLYYLPSKLYSRGMAAIDAVPLLYEIFSHGPNYINYLDVMMFYRYYGFSELFDALVNVNPTLVNYFRRAEDTYDVLLYFVMNPYKYSPNSRKKQIVDPKVHGLDRFFSKNVLYDKHVYYAYSLSTTYWRVPSLSELARDAIRTCIFDKLTRSTAQGSFNFILSVNKLSLPKCIKDILTFKEPIYRS